jgi:hypothetical protein
MAIYVHVVTNAPPQTYKVGPFGRTVYDNLKGNTRFPGGDAVLAVLDTKLKALDESLSKGTPAEKRAALEGVKEALGHVRDFVQATAETIVGTVDLLAIQALVESSGMALRKVGGPPKAVFAAKYGPVPGSVDLTAPASRARDPHDWELSTDQVNWKALPSTRQAKTRVTGLPIGVPHHFRHRLLTKNGTTEWSDPTVVITVK